MNPETLRDITRGVPAPLVAAVKAYVDVRSSPTTFLAAMLANDMHDACAFAPKDVDMPMMRALSRFIFNAVPGCARGSRASVNAWLSKSTPTPAWLQTVRGS